MTHQIKAIDLVDGERYTLLGPVEGVSRAKEEVVDRLMAAPHMLMSSEHGTLRFLMNPDEHNSYNNSNFNNNNNFPRRPPGPRFLDIYTGDLPNGDNQLFETEQLSVRNAVEKKAINQAVRNVYEKKTNTSASIGEGPANLIRGFLGVGPKKGGSKRSRRVNRRTKKSRRSRK